LEGDLPKGARPDLSVDGTIVLETLKDIVYVGRPVHGAEEANVGLFKIEPDGKHAIRVAVKLGRTSVSDIEIREGLNPGDRVILSDMSAQDEFDRVRLN
jgi:HlyD family secretion protein